MFGFFLYPIFGIVAIWNLLVSQGVSHEGDLENSIMLVVLFLSYYAADVVYDGFRGRHFFNPESFFVFFFSIFHFSYLVLYAFGLAEYEAEVFYDKLSLENAVNYSLACIVVFICTYRIVALRRASFLDKNMATKPALSIQKGRAIHLASKVLLLCAFSMFWLPVIPVVGIVFSDYRSLISIGEISPLGRLFWLGQYVGYCSIALYLASKSIINESLFKGWGFYLLVAYVASYLLTGDRGGFISYFSIIFFYYTYIEKRITLIKAAAIIGVLLAASAIVAIGRVESVFNPLEMIDLYSRSGKQSPLVEALSEFGLSIKTVVIAMYYVPDRYPYWFGASFVDSILIAIPNLFGARVSSGLGVFVTEVAFGPIALTYGRGGSIAMESYLNFGFFGIFLFSLYAFYLRKVFAAFSMGNGIVSSVVFYSSIGAFALWMRNTSEVTFRIVLWSAAVSFVILYFSSRERN